MVVFKKGTKLNEAERNVLKCPFGKMEWNGMKGNETERNETVQTKYFAETERNETERV